MVEVTKTTVVTATLTLSQEEAEWLKGLMQNALIADHMPKVEDGATEKMREGFFTALNVGSLGGLNG